MNKQKYLDSKSLSIVLFLFLFVLYAVIYMTKSMFSSAMASIVEEEYMTASQTGLINAAFWLVYAIFQVVGGFCADKFSPYKIIMLGLFGSLIANTIIYFNQDYYVMMGAWVFNAMAQFGIWPGVFKIISSNLHPNIRGKAVFWMLFAGSLGLGISMLVASFVSHWKNNFLVSIVSSIVLIVGYVIVNHFAEKRMVTVEQEVDVSKEKVEKAKLMPLMMSSGLIALMFVCLLRIAVDNGIKMLTPTMLIQSYEGLSAAVANRMSSILIICSALGIFVAGFVQKKITRNEAKAQFLLYSTILLPLIAVCFVGKIHYGFILTALAIVILLSGGASPFSQSFISVRFEKYGRIGTVSGILNAAASVGNVLASYIFAKMAEVMSWEGVAFSWVAAVVVCVVCCICVFPRWSRFLTE